MHAETLTFQTYETCILVNILLTKEENASQEIHIGGKKTNKKNEKNLQRLLYFFI